MSTPPRPSGAPPTPAAIKRAIEPFEFYRREIEGAPPLKENGKGWSQNFACPFHQDANGSFAVSSKTGAFHCFGCGIKGGSVIDFTMAYEKLDLDKTRAILAERYTIASDAPTPKGARKPKTPNPTPKAPPGPLVPIPAEALATRPTVHPTLGTPSATWVYTDAHGRPAAYVLRFEQTDSEKEFRPQTWTAAGGWTWTAPPEPRPLYRLNQLTAHPAAAVLICEGEKSADAAALLLPGMVSVATMNGAQAPAKSDLRPLAGRPVRVWPDHDQPGQNYARQISALALAAGAVSVEVLDLKSLAVEPRTGEPRELPIKWDAANSLADGWTPETLAAAARWVPIRTESAEPAAGPVLKVPAGYSLTKTMVFEVKEKPGDTPPEYVPLCGPLWIVGRTTGAHGEWGLVLAFRDHDGRERRLAIPSGRLHEDPGTLARELATIGFHIVPGKERRLLIYLAAWQSTDRILSAKRLGWVEDTSGALSFVMPSHVIARGGTREVVFQPDRFAPTIQTVHASGTLADWQAQIAGPACRYAPMLFVLCAGLAPAVMAFAEAADSFIVHLWGRSSRGKTALGQLAASPWGCAADPNDAPSMTFIRRWNLTANGLEGLAEAHSDLPLVLDELGSTTVGDIRPLVYQVSGGQGKGAMNSARELKEARAWRTIVISTGEESLHARMRDPDGDGARLRTVRGGLTHRALDIEIADIAEGAPIGDRGAIVKALKVSCARLYGTAGPELVRYLVGRFGTAADARQHIKERVAAVLSDIAPTDLPSETERALSRFALIAVAGELAAEAGIVPATAAAIRAATGQIARGWLGGAAETDDTRIVSEVRGFIFRHAARFQLISNSDPVPNRAGWLNRTDDLWLFTDDALAEAAPGTDKRTIARTLRRHGLLFTNDAEKLRARVGIGESRPWLYAVHGRILDGEKSGPLHISPGQPGQPGQRQQPGGVQPVPVAQTQPGQPGQPNGVSERDQPAPSASVPAVPVGFCDRDSPEDQQPQGFVPVVPVVPPNNRGDAFFPDGARTQEEI